ncbi:hypothetical protein BaRGS_00031070 [Batillaria attramentaria]|uniref:Uncharacterized protein n=1 Tax=Batillaria attramentaria TaxID=370345 RepID=A0ABD0JS17_9CAEN
MDLLQSYRTTVKINDNISYLYMCYQGLLMISTILGPATILLMMAGAFNAVMRISLWQSYVPVYWTSGSLSRHLLSDQAGKSARRTRQGCGRRAGLDGVDGSSRGGEHVLREILWRSEEAVRTQGSNLTSTPRSLRQVMEKLDKVETGLRTVASGSTGAFHQRRRSSSRSRHSKRSNIDDIEEEAENGDASSTSTSTDEDEHLLEEERDELINPKWLDDPGMRQGEVQYLPMREIEFWQRCIAKYLHPISADKVHEAKVAADLKSMRNNVAFAFFMMNAFWIIIIFMMQSVKDKVSIYIPRPGTEPLPIEPLGLMFLVVFAFILIIQFCAMLRHRWGTLLHILASTDIRCCKKKYDHKKAIREAVEYARMLQRLRGFDEDLTDQDFEYMSSSEGGRPHSNMYGPGDMVGAHMRASYDSDVPSHANSEPPYPLMFQNQGYQESTPNLVHDMGPAVLEERGKGRRNRRGRSTVVDKNNTLRRAFVRRYTKLLRQHSADVGGESSINQFLNDTAQRSRNQTAQRRETAEDLVSRFNRLNR